MKKFSLAFFGLSFLFLGSLSCKKINEATTLGGDLIPPVDNVNTFEVALEADVTNAITQDSVVVGYNDPVALGDINDPEFGNVHANFCFNLSSPVYGTYPFVDTVDAIDSVVLSLAFVGAYGDTMNNGVQTVSVYEIGQTAGFRRDTAYRYNDPASDFSGSLLGSKTYSIKTLRDTSYVKEPTDTGSRVSKYVNVLRIRLNNSIGSKIVGFDTSRVSPNAGFYTDSAFKTLFPGLAVKASNTGNALAFFNLADLTNTKLTIYYRFKKNTPADTSASVSFVHAGFGQSNYVNVQPGGNWLASIGNPDPQFLYIQGPPSGAYASIFFPQLDTFKNKVVHRAELIAEVVPSAADQIFTPPSRLFLDRIRKGAADSSFIFQNDLPTDPFNESVDFTTFGGSLRSNSYRFNISRYVQGIITRHERNDTLRLYAPLRTLVFNPTLISGATPRGRYQVVSVLGRIMGGRVVLAGSSYPIASQRLRLRIIYSNL